MTVDWLAEDGCFSWSGPGVCPPGGDCVSEVIREAVEMVNVGIREGVG